MPITSQFIFSELVPYIKGERRCRFYKEAVDQLVSFMYHSDGVYPKELIECRRPNEPVEVQEYREKIWKPKTKPTFTRLLSSLSKIRRSSDWSIKFPPAGDFPKVAEGETLEDYTTEKFPYFSSFTNWVFDVLLKKQLTDPNSVVLIVPLNPKAAQTEYIKPYPMIFDSHWVIEYIEEESAILQRPEGCWYNAGRDKKMVYQGKSFYIVNTQVVEQWDQVDGRENYALVMSYPHNFGFLPCFKIGAGVLTSDGTSFLYESRISGIIPDLDEALREYSDLQAAKVLHIFPERWEFTQNECTNCKGTGRRRNPGWYEGCAADVMAEITCGTCAGRGYVAAGPYSKMLIRPGNNIEGQMNIPNPPAGYVEKDVEIVKLMEDSVRQHIYDALAAINFQFIDQTPLNQSGTAKEVDKEELNNTVHLIAEDLVRVMDECYRRFVWYRYGTLYPSPTDLKNMQPAVAVPEQFDLLSAQFMQTELDAAKKSGMNPVITSALEIEFSQKRFDSEPEVRDRLALVLRLDPLPNVTEDEKMSRLSNKGITRVTYIISSNIQQFVQHALEENPQFATLDLKAQKEKMKEYAQAQVAEEQAAMVTVPEDVIIEEEAAA